MAKNQFSNVCRGHTLTTMVKLSLENSIQLKYLPRYLLVLLDSLMLAPVNMIENRKFNKTIENQFTIKKNPIFIIGHWRSGTTFLHNLMTQDQQFGFANLYQTLFPKSFIMIERSVIASRLVKDKIKNALPSKRPFDDMDLRLDLPYEEEFGIAHLVPYSFYHSFVFPRKSSVFFKKYALLKGISDQERDALKKSYSYFLKKLSFYHEGKQLLLKNPVNTARIQFLLSLFPKAKFIHIHRNPYDIFESMKNMWKKVSEFSQLNSISDTQLEKNILNQYFDLMDAYFVQKDQVPEFQLSEIGYDDLVDNPINEIKRIYKQLKLDYSDAAFNAMKLYLSTLTNKKCQYTLSSENKKNIRRHWAFAFEKLGYVDEIDYSTNKE